jgi:hypothetical protein
MFVLSRIICDRGQWVSVGLMSFVVAAIGDE